MFNNLFLRLTCHDGNKSQNITDLAISWTLFDDFTGLKIMLVFAAECWFTLGPNDVSRIRKMPNYLNILNIKI